MATWEDLDSESRSKKQEAEDEANVAMGLVATLTSVGYRTNVKYTYLTSVSIL